MSSTAPKTHELRSIIETLLFVADDPLSRSQIARVIVEEDSDPKSLEEPIAAALEEIAEDCNTKPYELVEVKSGFRLQVKEEWNMWVTKLLGQRARRYPRATMETLAIVAYRQPITRGEIEKIRGVAVNTLTIRNLMDRGWVREVGVKEVPGRPMLYGTTSTFLDYFGLKSLKELPPLINPDDISLDSLAGLEQSDLDNVELQAKETVETDAQTSEDSDAPK